MKHHIDANKTHEEKAKWELHENATSYFGQILEAASYKTTTIRPLTPNLKYHTSYTIKTYGEVVVEKGRTQMRCSSGGRPAKTYISSVWVLDAGWKTCRE